MSQIQLVYGSLTTAIAVLLSVDIGALVLLVGAQVIAEYERISREPIEASGRSLKVPLNAWPGSFSLATSAQALKKQTDLQTCLSFSTEESVLLEQVGFAAVALFPRHSFPKVTCPPLCATAHHA